jgi:hypothetical protein
MTDVFDEDSPMFAPLSRNSLVGEGYHGQVFCGSRARACGIGTSSIRNRDLVLTRLAACRVTLQL